MTTFCNSVVSVQYNCSVLCFWILIIECNASFPSVSNLCVEGHQNRCPRNFPNSNTLKYLLSYIYSSHKSISLVCSVGYCTVTCVMFFLPQSTSSPKSCCTSKEHLRGPYSCHGWHAQPRQCHVWDGGVLFCHF